MRTRYRLLQHLADGRFHSGQELADDLGLSRTAVWKAVSGLRELGLDIDAVSGRGYRLRSPTDLLDQGDIRRELDAAALDRLSQIEVHPELDSTSARLMALAPGASGPAACLAERQIAGRGRRGRQWASPFAANLYLSLLWRFDLSPAALGGVSLAVGVMLTRALGELGLTEPRLKWPNDLYWHDRKLAGILLELAGEASGPCSVVIGVGINCAMPAPVADTIDQPWADLREALGTPPSRNRLAARVLSHLVRGLDAFQHEGMAPFHEEWAALDYLAGRPVRLEWPGRSETGIARGIDALGGLRVEGEQGTRTFHSGEVSVRPIAEEGA